VLSIFVVCSTGQALCAVDFLDLFEVAVEQKMLQSYLGDTAGLFSMYLGVADGFQESA